MPREHEPYKPITGEARDISGHRSTLDEAVWRWQIGALAHIESVKADARIKRTAQELVCFVPYNQDEHDSTADGHPVTSFSLSQAAQELGHTVNTIRNGIELLTKEGGPLEAVWKPSQGQSGHGTVYAMRPLSGKQQSVSEKQQSVSVGTKGISNSDGYKAPSETTSDSDSEPPQATIRNH